MRNGAMLCLLLAALLAVAQDTKYPPQGQQFPGPPTKLDTADWLKELRQYREERLVRAGLNSELYDRPELRWAQSSFIQPQVMVEDRYLYDPVTRRYTVDRFLADLDKRYGGVDSVLLWPVYPNIGIDNRNQFDLLRDMPGGLDALRGMVADFHRRGVRVLFPTMPWAMGTRREPRSMPETIAALMKEIGADGINGDTFAGLPRSYRAASDSAGHPLVLEPEGYPDSDEMLNWNSMTWGYWKYPFAPMVSRGKWLEPRHMVNVCDRWNKDKTDNLQAAFFNGVGYETWENIWGIWNGITERDAEAIRRVAKLERKFAPYLVSADWEPHTPTIPYGVFASKFPKDGRALWLLVNRTVYNIDGAQIEVPAQTALHYFDLWRRRGAAWQLRRPSSFVMEASGFRRRSRRSPSRPMRGVECVPGRNACVECAAPCARFPRRGTSCRSASWRSNPPMPPGRHPQVWCGFPLLPGLRSRSTALRSKAATISASTCSIPGKIRRAAIT